MTYPNYNPNYDPGSQKPPHGFYSKWNLHPEDVKKLQTYELSRYGREELSLALYKTMKVIDVNGEPTVAYEKYLLFKGNLCKVVWQNDSLRQYLDPAYEFYYGEPHFIVSIRATREEKVALIQHDKTFDAMRDRL